jgi:hypothetical protein
MKFRKFERIKTLREDFREFLGVSVAGSWHSISPSWRNRIDPAEAFGKRMLITISFQKPHPEGEENATNPLSE